MRMHAVYAAGSLPGVHVGGDGVQDGSGLGDSPVLLDAPLRVEELLEVDATRVVRVGEPEHALQLEVVVLLAGLLREELHDASELVEVDDAVLVLVALLEEALQLVRLVRGRGRGRGRVRGRGRGRGKG